MGEGIHVVALLRHKLQRGDPQPDGEEPEHHLPGHVCRDVHGPLLGAGAPLDPCLACRVRTGIYVHVCVWVYMYMCVYTYIYG